MKQATELGERLEVMHETLRALSSEPDPAASVNGYIRAMRPIFGDLALVTVSTRGLQSGEYRITRFLHAYGVTQEGFSDVLLDEDNDAPVQRGGLFGELVRKSRPTIMREAFVARDAVLGDRLAPYHTIAALPIFDEGKVHNWVIHMSTQPDAMDDARIEFLFFQANLVGGIMNGKRLLQGLKRARAWIDGEIEVIAGIQRDLLPKATPRIPGIRFAAHSQSYDRAGGDLYDIYRITRDVAVPHKNARWGVIIADGKGHGPAATVMVAVMSALAHSYPGEPERPGALLEYLNHNLATSRLHEAFLTAFVGILEPVKGTLAYASAGHNMPLLRDRNGRVEALRNTGGIPLGVMDRADYEDHAITLEPGSALLLYTDGITEAMNPDEGLYGEERLAQVLAASNGDAGETMGRIVKDLRRHTGYEHGNDDQTLLLIHREIHREARREQRP